MIAAQITAWLLIKPNGLNIVCSDFDTTAETAKTAGKIVSFAALFGRLLKIAIEL